MRKPPYGILMQDGHSAELIETLIAKVTDMAERHFKEEANQETSARIPWIVEEVVTERVPASGPDMSDEGGRSYLYCEDCHDAPCCSEREIAVTIFDATKLAKALGMTRKKFVKEYLARYEGDSPTPPPVAAYVFKHVSTCKFLDENARCRVYKARPLVCRIFPFDFNDDGKAILAAYDYCNYGFNMMKHQCFTRLILEEMRERFPEECGRIEANAQKLQAQAASEEDYARILTEANGALQTLSERFVRQYPPPP